ncbi:hypothetical protein KFL_000050700 [Klebsormidium nitens]|uniref:ACT domain-containing protein n=1 Tax=Klebsormidium nitens TaxID=105231 RepID=A0A1Y1HHI8_KLENI|nr:hypothetical protein KFL_000050700 [Klebsormidium nitens]|eukprot:GAQ77935.1 hypothetical protein KFL_000050700 [Klebsormidium nitens]
MVFGVYGDPRSQIAMEGDINSDVVTIRVGEPEDELTELTVSCTDKVGLGCDLASVVLEFGLNVVKGDFLTDGRWCHVVFWVETTRCTHAVSWPLLKERMTAVCPSLEISLTPRIPTPAKQDVFLLQVRSADRMGLLNDVTQLLWENELTVHKVNICTSPDNSAVDLFYITDNRNELPKKRRRLDVLQCIRDPLGDDVTCDITLAAPEFAASIGSAHVAPEGCLPGALAPHLAEGPMTSSFEEDEGIEATEVSIDNGMSRLHSALQVSTRDRKGLLYDCLRTLKDVNIQVAYGRIALREAGLLDIDFFIRHPSGHKVTDPKAQRDLCGRLRQELERPIRLVVAPRGPDTELLVAAPVEVNGRSRPRMFYDCTLGLRRANACVFQADISRHAVNNKHWEVHRFLVQDSTGQPITSPQRRQQIAKTVRSLLIG